MRTIQLKVKEDTARKVSQLSPKEKESLAHMIDLWVQDERTLREVMDDISTYAKQQGLTPELLEKLLKEE
jgi:hypothetical protein